MYRIYLLVLCGALAAGVDPSVSADDKAEPAYTDADADTDTDTDSDT